MVEMLWVGLGGFVGAILRYAVSIWAQSQHETAFPLGTFLVNATGCFLIGLLMTFFDRGWVSPQAKLLLGSGLLGALTTFSTFSWETLDLIRSGAWLWGAVNVLGNVLVALVAVSLGFFVGRLF